MAQGGYAGLRTRCLKIWYVLIQAKVFEFYDTNEYSLCGMSFQMGFFFLTPSLLPTELPAF